jgi:single stranded DNA-binding protein
MNNTYIGRLGGDPALRFSESGNAWMGVSFAIECRVKENGEWVSKPVWTDLKIFGDMAGNVADVATKGTRLIVIGELRPTSFQNKEGVVVERLELLANDVGLDLRFGRE